MATRCSAMIVVRSPSGIIRAVIGTALSDSRIIAADAKHVTFMAREGKRVGGRARAGACHDDNAGVCASLVRSYPTRSVDQDPVTLATGAVASGQSIRPNAGDC